jgi:hypothetical protein
MEVQEVDRGKFKVKSDAELYKIIMEQIGERIGVALSGEGDSELAFTINKDYLLTVDISFKLKEEQNGE